MDVLASGEGKKHIGLRLADKDTIADLSRGTIVNKFHHDIDLEETYGKLDILPNHKRRACKLKITKSKKRKKTYGKDKKKK